MATTESARQLEAAILDQVLEALCATQYACSSLQRLSGGTSAFTYRGHLKSPLPDSDATTVIVKRTEPYIAMNPAWSLDISRSDYEAIILTALESSNKAAVTEHSTFRVQAPRIYKTVPEQPHTLLMQDLTGSLTLKDYLEKPEYTGDMVPERVEALGFALGKWLVSLHQWGKLDLPEVNELRAKIVSNPMKTLKYQINIGRYLATVDHFPDLKWADRKEYEEIDQAMKKDMEEEGSLVHGDFWTGNILLKDGPLASWSTTNPCDVFIVDFEFSHIGNVAQDLGQCFAELYLICYFRDVAAAGQLISSIAEGYCASQAGGKSDELGFQVAMHFGIHLANWPWRVGRWKESPLLPAYIEFGDQCLLRGYRRDREWFRDGVLDALFP